MIVFRTQVAAHVSLTRKEGRYMSPRQATLVVKHLSEALGLSALQTDIAMRFLKGSLSLATFNNEWSGSPAEHQSIIGTLIWFSSQPCDEHVHPKGSYIVYSNNSQSLCDRSVVFTTKRNIPLSPITKDLVSRGYACWKCTEMYASYMRETYPHGYI